MNECQHNDVECVNPYELIRKYKCTGCGEIMMCDCEKDFALRFLPHQISFGTWLDTQQPVPVTNGFQPKICNACKGLEEEAHPKAEIFGYTSKIKRYYWREIYFGTTNLFDDWATSEGYSDIQIAQRENPEKYKEIEKKALDKIKKLHTTNPKYSYSEQSQQEVLDKNKVEIINLSAVYSDTGQKGKLIVSNTGVVSPEAFVSLHFHEQGYETLETESIPFHVLFGVYIWFLIEDSNDPLQQAREFGDRNAFEEKIPDKAISMNLPTDFGTMGYGKRRREEIQSHFDKMLPTTKAELLKVFDIWLKPSENLRQYLWAHKESDIQKARRIVEILPPKIIRIILKYLIDDYWKRYLGWPDLLVFKIGEYIFVEVKSSKDKLSEDQKRWINDNSKILSLPFKLVKIHKSGESQ